MTKVLYFGNFDPNFSRNKVFADGLKQNGIDVGYCVDNAGGLKKYINLYKKHKAIKDYDALIVGYSGHLMSPFAKLIHRKGKPVIFDALCSFYESEILSRDAFKSNPFRVPMSHFIDWLANKSADYILVETDRQKEYFENNLKVRKGKCVTVYTGVDEDKFKHENEKKYQDFTVLFRGKINLESGASHVLNCAKRLESTGIKFLFIGYGWGKVAEDFKDLYSGLKLTNFTWINKQVEQEEMLDMMTKCHVSIGQLEKHERLERTIPHKAFESMILKLPYVTARTGGVLEVLEDGKHALMVNPADEEDLAEKILLLRDNVELRNKLVSNMLHLYENKFSPAKIVLPIIGVLKKTFI